VASAPLTIVIGAGISGLSCAHALKKSGQNVLLLEASSRPGGVIQSVEENGYLFELGPQSFGATSELAELCDQLRLTEQLLEAPHGAARYVLIGGELKKVPVSPSAFIASGLLSWGTKFSLLRDACGRSAPPESDESVGAFTRRKFSEELLERLVGPFISGIYAGDPEQLSLRAAFPQLYAAEKSAGSVVRGAMKLGRKTGKQGQPQPRPGLLSFQTGNEKLVRALASELGPSLRLSVQVSEIARARNTFRLRTANHTGSQDFVCDSVVLATPTGASASLLQEMAPAASVALNKISYAPLAVVSLGYKREQIGRSLNGFGFLAPRSSGLRTLGSVWNSSVFPSRVPRNHALLTNFVGGATDASAAMLSDAELASLVHCEIAPILKIRSNPAASRVTRYAQAIPQYNLGHLERLREIQATIAQVPGLRLIGNYWNGPAIGVCVQQALAVAEEIRIG
jgi:oxygen-dependent protoporphyrinogen oxidase